MLTKDDFYKRLERLHWTIANDVGLVKGKMSYSTHNMWETVYLDMLNGALIMKINEYNKNYCQNKKFNGDCRLALLSCYMRIMAGLREAALRYE